MSEPGRGAGEATPRAARRFDPDVANVAPARHFVEGTLRRWGHDDIVDDVALVATELVTNAFLHARTPITLAIHALHAGVRVEVVDDDPRSPTFVPAPLPAELIDDLDALDELEATLAGESMGGRGLVVVNELAVEWGTQLLPDGKIVWAHFGAPGGGASLADEQRVDEPAGRVRPARLVAVPVRLAIESEANLEDVERELLFLRSDEAGPVPAALVERALTLLARARQPRVRARDAAREAAAAGRRLVDVDLAVTTDAPAVLWQFLGALEEVAGYSRRGALLTVAPRPEVVAFRRWLGDELERQARGQPPAPSPFPVLSGEDEAVVAAIERAHRELSTTSRVLDQHVTAAVLADAVAALAPAADAGTVARVAVQAAFEGVAAVNGSLCLVQPDGTTMRIAAAVGYDERVTDHWGSFPLNGDYPASEAIRTGKPVVLRTAAERDARYPALAGTPVVGSDALAVLPVSADQAGPLGALVVGFGTPRDMSVELPFLEALAAATGTALARLRAVDDEQATGERRRYHDAVVAELERSRELDSAVAVILARAVPQLGDWASVHVRHGAGIRLVGARHTDPAKQALAEELHTRWPPSATPTSAIADAFETGASVVFNVVSDEVLAAVATSGEHLDVLRSLGFAAGMVVPAVDPAGTTVAVLAVANGPGRPVTDADQALASALMSAAAARLAPGR